MPTENVGNSYVSRAEGKLAGAVRAFSYDFRGKVVLDIGSSTGGFTEFALRHGAEKVIAVEKGTNQMKAPLRFDKRVELHEKCDIRNVFWRIGLEGEKCHTLASGRNIHFSPSNLVNILQNTYPDVILADVSFISLREILTHAKAHLAGVETDFLVMLKPQFEARSKQLVKGVVKNEKMRREIIRDFENWLKRQGFVIVGKRDNEVVGKNGNQERFYFLKFSKKVCKNNTLVVK